MMKNFLLIISLCSIQHIVAQETLLKGNVSESLTRGIVVGAKISLQKQEGESLLTRSNLDGQYIFNNLEPGKYTAIVTMLFFLHHH